MMNNMDNQQMQNQVDMFRQMSQQQGVSGVAYIDVYPTSGSLRYKKCCQFHLLTNNALLEIPAELTPLVASEETDIITLWNGVLLGVAPVRHITVEKLMESIDRVPHINVEWRGYIRNRYGV